MLAQLGADGVVIDGLDAVWVGEAVASPGRTRSCTRPRGRTTCWPLVDDEPAPVSGWLPYLAVCAGAKPPMRVPRWLARLLAGQVAVTVMTEGRGFSNAKARRELGWELRYPSWRQGFKAGLA